MKQILLFFLVLVAMTTNAQNTLPPIGGVLMRESADINTDSRKHQLFCNGKRLCPEYFAPEKTNSELQKVSVTPEFTLDTEAGEELQMLQWAIPSGGAIEEGWPLYPTSAIPIGGGKYMIFPWSIPTGTYDFVGIATSPRGILCVCKEAVKISNDTTINFDMSDATNHIKFDPRLPNGETPLPWVNWETFQQEAPGNCTTTALSSHIYHRNGHNVMTFSALLGAHMNDDGTISDNKEKWDIWTNPTAVLQFFQIFTAATQTDGSYHMPMIAIGSEPQTVTNRYKEYVSYTDRFQPSLTYGSLNDIPSFSNAKNGVVIYVNGQRDLGSYTPVVADNNILMTSHFSLPDITDTGFSSFVICPSNVYIQKYYEKEYGSDLLGIIAPPVNYSEQKWYTLTTDLYSQCANQIGNLFTAGPDPYAFSKSTYPQYALEPDQAVIMGDNCPVTVFVKYSTFPNYAFIGRYAENRTIDYIGSSVSIMKDGESICSSWDELQSASSSWPVPEEWTSPGSWDYEIINENMEVDGLQGRNTCQEHLEATDNYCVPTVTHLQFRDESGTVTDRLDKPEGSIYFSAGVWTGYSFEYSPLSEVTLSYRPYGEEEWLPMTVTPEGESYLPGYGQLYMADPAAIERKSETGWFDLRIEIADNNGNYQWQEISPALKISSLSGIDRHELTPGEIRVEGKSIIAPEGADVYDLGGRRMTDLRNLMPGLYVVKVNGCSRKICISF